jgi:hypothetical protein
MRFELKYYYSSNGSIYSGGNPGYKGETESEIRGYTVECKTDPMFDTFGKIAM